MKTKIDPTAENEVQLTVEIPAEAVQKAYDRLVAKVRGEMVLPGFRKGRVPMALVIQQVGADYLRAETLEESIPQWGDEALREAGLYDDAVGTSDLTAGPLDEAADYTFSLKVQTMPVPTLGEYKGLEVPQRVVAVTEAQIDAQLAMLQERLAKLEPVEDRAVQTGDFVLMDLEGSQDGKPIEGAQGADQMFEIGGGNLVPGFEDALVGVARGEETTFDVTFPDDYQAEELAGQPATFKVNVKEIKKKVVPELDDAFAADVSEFDTLAELRADMRARMEAAAEAGVRREFRAAAVDKAAANATVGVPSTMIDREAHRLFHELEESVGERGLSMEVYLNVLEKTEEQVEEELRPQAELIIKRRLVLEEIAKAEGLSVSDDEMLAVIRSDAEALERDPLQLIADLRESGRQEAVRDEMLLAKAVDFVADASVPVAMTEADEAAAEDAADAADTADDY
ncbi:MAG: trigger factor [Actinobacteria bacterium]|nr:trigger factor [Actinomycetota bacterium]